MSPETPQYSQGSPPYKVAGHRLYGPEGLLAEFHHLPASDYDLVERIAALLNAAVDAGINNPHLIGDVLECVRCGQISDAQAKLAQAKRIG